MPQNSFLATMPRGLSVIVGLIVLTLVDYLIATYVDAGRFALLSLFAVVEAWLILQYFMHLSKVCHPKEQE